MPWRLSLWAPALPSAVFPPPRPIPPAAPRYKRSLRRKASASPLLISPVALPIPTGLWGRSPALSSTACPKQKISLMLTCPLSALTGLTRREIMGKIVIDPVTRIEGHLKIECVVENGAVKDARATGSLFRGLESILRGRDPREAQIITQRICGVCPQSHRTA